ncbi:flagellar basal body-associated FliL family protein [Pseudoteredinibacter isoporae]|uniref:Flagellar protein FliL n=1 Tax=Pseudoteredinibacter isoporae TaxID=570281 RepID=A0A7X0JWD6_9GAMM|nr:flagellar basal body-associated FliL family protein [Pseudoteredinibacter isoporae]MBB6523467.1 flagellar FliL protein [Pseudoteredinibacter isoporae]NHO88976.1 flagellar basal body-associated protein FliL [Pseudoteredinibacter isoporae]NIB24316.1 flagellar basal body-associated protein FliL [Pseudoteredinibacter isoporae]
MAEENESQGGGKKKLIIFIVLGLVLIGASVGGTLFALGFFDEQKTEQTEEGEGEGEENPEEAEEGEEGDEMEAAEPTPSAIYLPLKPPIIVNFEARGRQRYLQVEVTLMMRTEQALSAAELHMPMIRNALVMLFSGQIYEELQTPEGKELVRQLALEEVQTMMDREIGEPGVEQVLFTNFVMQ